MCTTYLVRDDAIYSIHAADYLSVSGGGEAIDEKKARIAKCKAASKGENMPTGYAY